MTAVVVSVRSSMPGRPQRSCNGCRLVLGDVRVSDWVNNGGTPAYPGSTLTDVRAECPTCNGGNP